MAVNGKSFYAARMKPTLRDLITVARGSDTPQAKLTLAEEVDIARILAASQLDEMMELAITPVDQKLTPQEFQKAQAAKVAAAEFCKKAVNDVAATVHKAAQVRSLATDAATAEDIEFVLNQVVAIIEAVVAPTDPVMARTIQDQIEKVQMPNRHRDLPDANKLLLKAVGEIEVIENGSSAPQADEPKTKEGEF